MIFSQVFSVCQADGDPADEANRVDSMRRRGKNLEKKGVFNKAIGFTITSKSLSNMTSLVYDGGQLRKELIALGNLGKYVQ
jgi:hypothetical protein